MLTFQGERTFSKPLSHVFTRLTDAAFLLSSLPDVEEVVSADRDRAVWKLRPGFTFVRGTLEVTLTVTERTPETAATYDAVSRGIGAGSTVRTRLEFEPSPSGTLVRWSAEIIEITGLMKMIPKGLIQSAAGKVIDQTWDGIQKKIDSEA